MIRRVGHLAAITMLLVALMGAWGPATAQPVASPAPLDAGTADPVAEDPAYVRDLLPIAVLGLAVGGAVGFELSRRGL